MRRTSLFILSAVALLAVVLGIGFDIPVELAAQRLPFGRRPLTRSALTKKRRAVQAGPAYWVKDILQGYQLDSLFPIADGRFLVSGWISSPSKAYTIMLSPDGTVEWAAQRLSDSSWMPTFTLYGMTATADGNIVGAGNYASSSSSEAAVVKFTPAGEVLWAYCYGGPYVDEVYWIAPAQDGGFLITGKSLRDGGAGGDAYTIWVIKIDAQGAVQWERAFECLDEDTFMRSERDIGGVQLSDSGYVVVANTRLSGSGEFDFLLIKLDTSGNVEWQKTYGGPGYESLLRKGPHLQATADGGMVLAGSTTSYGFGNTDIWVLKLTAGGDIEWQKAIGGYDYESCNSVRVAPDGGYILAGDAGGRFGLVKLSATGEIEWNRGYGGRYAETVSAAGDGSYFMGGRFGSDVLVMKTSSQGLISDSCGYAESPPYFVVDTNAVPVSVSFEPYVMGVAAQPFAASFSKGLAISSETVCWNLNQPPIPVSLVRSINRGLFRGEASYTLTWNANAANAAIHIAQYRIYRRIAGGAISDFRVVGTVPGDYLIYLDANLDMSEDYEYALTSVDDEGHESPKSIVLGGEIVN